MRPLGGNPEVQAAFEQKQIAGMVTSVRPRSPANCLMNAADLEVPFAMNAIAVTPEFLQKMPRPQSGCSELISKA